MALDILYAKVAQLVEQVKHLFYPYWKIRRLQYKQKSYGIVNPRVVGSSPTLGAVVCTTILIVQPLSWIYTFNYISQ